jgi:aryl-alcohol dehydrogenase-like predicted oxidoreductase
MSNSTTMLADNLSICRILNGMWQVAGGHGQINHELAVLEMIKYHEDGFTTWDLADIYGPAESLVGNFRKKINSKQLSESQTLTKFVPNPGIMTKPIVEYHIDNSLNKMKTNSLDLLQFHWWDYNDSNFLDALKHLFKLKEEGKIRHIGLTNFDTKHVKTIIEKNFNIVSNQIQYSVLDQRPEKLMIDFCKKHQIKILAYGTLLGGFLSEKYLNSKEPKRSELTTLSLQKYYNMIVVWGGWKLFQDLLTVLAQIAEKHDSSIANVCTKFILDKQMVAGVIIGTRLGLSEHRHDTLKVFDLDLDSDDHFLINSVTKRSNSLFEELGDCGDEYR